MKRLISMIFAFAMMGATLPMISCSDNEEKVLESLEKYSIKGEWLVIWSSEDLNGQTMTIEITRNRIYIYMDGKGVDYYAYTLGGNMITLGDKDDPEGYITIEKLTEYSAEIKLRSEWLDGTCKMKMRRID